MEPIRITVINGTAKHGATYRLKELFLEEFRGKAQITEFDLPKDGPDFCTGCTNCILRGEGACRDAGCVRPIEQALLEADLIVMTSPTYVFHTTGAMKNLLDHLAFRWMPHRPAAEMFGKRAVILTQCLGSGAKTAAKDIRHSLSWWGISSIHVCACALMGGTVWEELPEARRQKLTGQIRRLAAKMARVDYTKPAHTSVVNKAKFMICRSMQKSLHKADPAYTDGAYWSDQGFLGKRRPWKAAGGSGRKST